MIFQNTFQQMEPPSQTYLSCFTYTGDANGSYPRHCHFYYEISYIISGRRYETLNDLRYEVGDNSLLFIPPLTIHNLTNITEVEDLVIQFDHQLLRNSSILFDSKYLVKPDKAKGDYFRLAPSDNICVILDQIIKDSRRRDVLTKQDRITIKDASHFMEKLTIDLTLNSLCLQLISAMLGDGKLYVDMDGVAYAEMINLDPLVREMIAHPEKPIDMQTASRMAGMSYSHFSRFFEKVAGVNYVNFCNILRIRHAEELLLTTQIPVAEVADSIGISTISYFTRLFKQINGDTPSNYRKMYQSS